MKRANDSPKFICYVIMQKSLYVPDKCVSYRKDRQNLILTTVGLNY